MSDVDPNVKGTDNKEDTGYVKMEDLSRIVNSAITSHLKRLDFDSKITSALEAAIAPLKEVKKVQSSDKVENSEVEELRKNLQNLQKQLKEKDEKAAQMAKAARDKEGFAQLKSTLSGKVRPEAVDAVAKLLFHADKKVQVSEEGELIWQDGETYMDLDSGLKSYLKSKEAAIYLPAPVTSKKTNHKSQLDLSGILRNDKDFGNENPKGNLTQAAAVLQNLGLKL